MARSKRGTVGKSKDTPVFFWHDTKHDPHASDGTKDADLQKAFIRILHPWARLHTEQHVCVCVGGGVRMYKKNSAVPQMEIVLSSINHFSTAEQVCACVWREAGHSTCYTIDRKRTFSMNRKPFGGVGCAGATTEPGGVGCVWVFCWPKGMRQ